MTPTEHAQLLRKLAESATALAYESHGRPAAEQMTLAARARTAAEKIEKQQASFDVEHVLNLAAIIREVDGHHSLGAASLAEAVLSHPRIESVLGKEDSTS